MIISLIDILGIFGVSSLEVKNVKEFFDEFINEISLMKICEPLSSELSLLSQCMSF
jgi:hypothetical protein